MKKITQNDDGTVTIDGEQYEITKKVEGRWRPALGQMAWHVDADLTISEHPWEDDKHDKIVFQQDNIFQKAEEAQEYADFLKAKGTISHYIRTTYPLKPDWARGNFHELILDVEGGAWAAEESGAWPVFLFPTIEESSDVEETIARFPKELEIVKQYLLTHN